MCRTSARGMIPQATNPIALFCLATATCIRLFVNSSPLAFAGVWSAPRSYKFHRPALVAQVSRGKPGSALLMMQSSSQQKAKGSIAEERASYFMFGAASACGLMLLYKVCGLKGIAILLACMGLGLLAIALMIQTFLEIVFGGLMVIFGAAFGTAFALIASIFAIGNASDWQPSSRRTRQRRKSQKSPSLIAPKSRATTTTSTTSVAMEHWDQKLSSSSGRQQQPSGVLAGHTNGELGRWDAMFEKKWLRGSKASKNGRQ